MGYLADISGRTRYYVGRLRGEWRALWIRLLGGKCGSGLSIGYGVIWKYAPHPGIEIGNDVQIGEYCMVDVPECGRLILSDSVKFSMGCLIAARKSIEIGKDSQFGEYCSIRDADHGIAMGMPIRLQSFHLSPIIIGANVWTGRGCAILRGAQIGDDVVIGANAVVLSEPLQSTGIYVGAPCRLVKNRK